MTKIVVKYFRNSNYRLTGLYTFADKLTILSISDTDKLPESPLLNLTIT